MLLLLLMAARLLHAPLRFVVLLLVLLFLVVAVVLLPLSLAITHGILWGFLLHALLYVVAGRWREVSVTLWLLAALSAGLLLLGH